ncbi:MAG: 30S ribosomal protein S15 [Parcubacteria group bacterium GW2011_GWC2_39_14]|nr:MAG: 30S ribosomal protein S15 [Parcubacteria group bacterium GW2011_GWC2_39_14]KKR53441.1 MAG: 30S ribosomal protein S15 [Parcubacteria group bacterium GW2011_GWA2_40_23]
MLDPKKKQAIINKYKKHDSDTGSAEVQIAILSEEVKELTKHLKTHKHDHSSRRGLLKKLGERRRLMRYLEIDNQESYKKLIEDLKIKPLKREQKVELFEEGLEEEDETKVEPEEENSTEETEE